MELPNELAAVSDQLLLFYHPHPHGGEDEVELWDPRRRRTFLKRAHVPGLRVDDLVLGSRVTLFARHFLVRDYEDDATRRALQVAQERAVAVLPASALGRAWLAVERAGLRVVNVAWFTASGDDAAVMSAVTAARVPAHVPVAALDVQGAAARDTLAQLPLSIPPSPASAVAGATADADEWVATAADGAGDGQLRSLLWGGGAAGQPPRDQQLPSARPAAPSPTRAVGCASCVLVLPSAVARRQAGAILADVQGALCAPATHAGAGEAVAPAPLAVTALSVTQLTRPQAERFLEVYKGVLRNYLVRRGCLGAAAAARERVRRDAGEPGQRAGHRRVVPGTCPGEEASPLLCAPTVAGQPTPPLPATPSFPPPPTLRAPPAGARAQDMVTELSSGPLVALLVSGPGAVQRMRDLAGPRDVDVARHIRCVRVAVRRAARAIWGRASRARAGPASAHACTRATTPAVCPRAITCRPQSLRARYGESAAKPGLHVTDLPEDGPLEAEAVFPAPA